MKQVLSIFFAGAILLASCNQNEMPVAESNLQTVSVQFAPYVMEPMTRAVQSVSELSNFLDIWLVEGETVTAFHQIKADEDFGTLTMALDKTKTYTLHAIAHKGNGEAELEDGVISFANDKITDPFFYTTTFSPANTTELTCVMNRISGQFKLETSDAVPEEVTKFRFTVTGSGTQWNVNGTLENNTQRVVTVNLTARNNDGSATFNLYVLPENTTGTTPVSILVEAMDAEDNVLQQRTLTEVGMKAGYRTTYRGAFFIGVEATAGFSADGEWSIFDTVAY